MFAWLALLVKSRIFRKVIISFLPVGHTHEDIDQFFSCIARALRKRPAHSRIMLAEVMVDSYTSGGVCPIIKHWENVANISGWLDSRCLELTDVMSYHQFRLFVSASDGEVWLQGRVWPGASEQSDSYGGLSGNDTHAQIFRNNVYPNLVEEFDAVPRSQSCFKPPSQEILKKVREGLDDMFKHMNMTDRDVEDCNLLFRVYSSRPEAMHFEWSRLDVAVFFQGRDEAVLAVRQVAPRQEHINATGDIVCVNDFQLTMPANEHLCAETYPFGISRIKHVLHDSAGEAIVHIQDWLLELGQDPFTGRYKVHDKQKDGLTRAKYPLRKIDEGFQATVIMTVTNNGTYAHLHGASVRGQKLARYWAARFAGGEDMKMEASEEMNQHGFEGVENPRPKERKKPKKRSKAGAKEGQGSGK